LGQAVGAVFLVLGHGAVRFRATGAIGAFVHLAARAEIADAWILRRAERTGVEAIAAPDADVFRMQHDGVRGGVEGVHRTHRLARRVGAMHAGHRYRALARLAVIDGNDAPAVDAPRHLIFVLAGRDAGIALDAAVGVAQKFHPSHGVRLPLCRPDLTEADLGFLHSGRRVVTVGHDGIRTLAKDVRIGARRIFRSQVLTAEPAAEMEGHPGHALADALGDQSLHLRLGAVFGARHPDPAAVRDAALRGIRRIDLDEHVLLQL